MPHSTALPIRAPLAIGGAALVLLPALWILRSGSPAALAPRGP